jgi:hypothetical protein
MPVTAVNMNYACLITGAMSIFAAIWWFVKGGSYVGPQALIHEDEMHHSHGGLDQALAIAKAE